MLFDCIGGYDRGECLNTFESYDISSNKWFLGSGKEGGDSKIQKTSQTHTN